MAMWMAQKIVYSSASSLHLCGTNSGKFFVYQVTTWWSPVKKAFGAPIDQKELEGLNIKSPFRKYLRQFQENTCLEPLDPLADCCRSV